MRIHARMNLGLPVVHRIAQGLLARGGPLTKREVTRLRKNADAAQIVFRDEAISNAVIRELLARAEAAALPCFERRPWPLARLNLGGPRQ